MSTLVLINETGTYEAPSITPVTVSSVGTQLPADIPDTFVIVNGTGTYTFPKIVSTNIVGTVSAVSQPASSLESFGTTEVTGLVPSIGKPNSIVSNETNILGSIGSVATPSAFVVALTGIETKYIGKINAVSSVTSTVVDNGHSILLEVIGDIKAVVGCYSVIERISNGVLYETSIAAAGQTLSISSSGSLFTIPSIVSKVNVLNVSGTSQLETTPYIGCAVTVNKVSLSLLSYTANSIQASPVVNSIGMRGGAYSLTYIALSQQAFLVSTKATASLSSTQIIIPDADDIFDSITGNNYIVVNLRTKSHTTYRDGSNIAAAQTGLLNFGTVKDKNISDAYLWSRSSENIEFHVKNNEITERKYLANFAEVGQENLSNKKIVLSKGLKGSNWQFAIVSNGNNYSEIRTIDLVANELQRRV